MENPRFLAALEMTRAIALSAPSKVKLLALIDGKCGRDYSDCDTMPSAELHLNHLRRSRADGFHAKEI